jgi:carboxymethylenebutenolidase
MSHRTLKLATDRGPVDAYLAEPDQGGGTGVIVLQEWWGLVPHIKKVCDRLAREGFVALAPDLYHGRSAKSPDEAGKLMMALSIAEAEQDLRAAIGVLLREPKVTSRKVGVIGFCMGGQLALFAATLTSDIGACVDFYGIHPHVKPDLKSLRAPVLGLFAEHDGSVPPEAVRHLEEQLLALGKEADFTIYPGVSHAFFNDERPAVHHPASAEDAWKKTVAFLRRHLDAGGTSP